MDLSCELWAVNFQPSAISVNKSLGSPLSRNLRDGEGRG